MVTKTLGAATKVVPGSTPRRRVTAEAVDRAFARPHQRGCECSDCDASECCEACDERVPLVALDDDGICDTCNAAEAAS